MSNLVLMFNFGLDLSVWTWVGATVLASIAFLAFAWQAYKLVRILQSSSDHNHYQYRKTRKQAIWRTAIAAVFGSLIILGLFGAYGAGTPTSLPDMGDEIHQAAPKEPTKQQLEKDAKKKRDPELKKQKRHFKKVQDPSDRRERDDADRYERDALDRARRNR